jgi:hypothetical protein
VTTDLYRTSSGDERAAAAARVATYLRERECMGHKDRIHGYQDGDGHIVVELRASDLRQLLNTPKSGGEPEASVARPASARPVSAPVPRREQPVRPARRVGADDEEAELERRAAAGEVILAAWPGPLGHSVLAAVVDAYAFGALAWKLHQVARDGADPVEILQAIGTATVEWSIGSARNPAAFLASRVRETAE